MCDPLFVHGDCRDLVGVFGPHQMVFGDPPFNIGEDYIQHNDRLPPADFEKFTIQWVAAAWQAVSPCGVLVLHGPDTLCELYLLAARRLGFADRRIAWVQWQYNFGVYQPPANGNFIDSRCHCLIYAKGPTYTWNVEEEMVVSARVRYKDKRVTADKGGSKVPGTVWGIEQDGPHWGRVTGNSGERWAGKLHPNQLPERYMARLIRIYTNPMDKFCDMFCGSGTGATVAAALGREAVTFDVSRVSLISARERHLRRGAVHI